MGMIRLSLAKWISQLFAGRPGVFRLVKFVYDYESAGKKDLWIVISYLESHRILVNTREIIGWKVFFWGEYERATNEIIREHVGKGDTVVEAGSNIGTETILLSKLVGETGKVYAFEPVPSVYSILKANTALNFMEHNVQVEPLCLGAENTEVELYLLPQDFPNQGMSSKLKHSKSDASIRVEQLTIDDYMEINKISKIDFIKMDVQGGEKDILLGGIGTIKKHRPKIFLEAGDGWSSLRDLYDLLIGLNYRVYHIGRSTDGLKELREPNLAKGNWLAIPDL